MCDGESFQNEGGIAVGTGNVEIGKTPQKLCLTLNPCFFGGGYYTWRSLNPFYEYVCPAVDYVHGLPVALESTIGGNHVRWQRFALLTHIQYILRDKSRVLHPVSDAKHFSVGSDDKTIKLLLGLEHDGISLLVGWGSYVQKLVFA